jgi:hypothetical protein
MAGMNPRLAAAALAFAAIGAPSRAQEASAEPRLSPESKVQNIVIEDKGSKIEELRVRGQTQRIVVTPKVGTSKRYEIIPADGSREMFDGANTSRGAAGKRVWNVLDF